MNINEIQSLKCPKCGNNDFELKRAATYVYTYQIDSSNKQSQLNKSEELPFLFDNRKQVQEAEYIVCKNCGSSYPCSIGKAKGNMTLTME